MGVDVAVTRAMDPYVGDRLHVHSPSPVGRDFVRYLTRRGDWADAKVGVETVDGGFEMPMGFGEALKNAFQAELKQLKRDYEGLTLQADTAIEAREKLAALANDTAKSAVRRIEQLEAEVAELQEELEAWREGRFSR